MSAITSTSSSPVWCRNEWDPLEEVLVGRATNARIAMPDRGLHAVEYSGLSTPMAIPSGDYDQRVIEETEEDLAVLIEELTRLNVIVRRPDIFDHSMVYGSPDWSSDGQYNYCPRDLFLTLGDKLIEAPMTLRCRQYETWSFKSVLTDYLQKGACWIAAPRPRLADSMYRRHNTTEQDSVLGEDEPVFDAANVLKLGDDLLYLISDTGNRMGADWLQRVVGADFQVHAYKGVYSGSHVDTTIAPIREGLVVLNGERIHRGNVPDLFEGWDQIFLTDIVDIGFTGTSYASKWIGMNLLMVTPDLAIVDSNQMPLIRALQRHKVSVLPLQLRHARTLGGGFHCVTLDIRRHSP